MGQCILVTTVDKTTATLDWGPLRQTPSIRKNGAATEIYDAVAHTVSRRESLYRSRCGVTRAHIIPPSLLTTRTKVLRLQENMKFEETWNGRPKIYYCMRCRYTVPCNFSTKSAVNFMYCCCFSYNPNVTWTRFKDPTPIPPAHPFIPSFHHVSNPVPTPVYRFQEVSALQAAQAMLPPALRPSGAGRAQYLQGCGGEGLHFC